MNALHSLIALVPLGVALIMAAVQDVRTRTIRNPLTATIALAGLAQSWLAAGSVSPGASILGLLLGFALSLPMFILGGNGGGDVKLLAAVGAWVGPIGIAIVYAAAALFGAAAAVGQAIFSGQLGQLASNSALLAVNIRNVRSVGVEHVQKTGQTHASAGRPWPYAVSVLVGVSLLILLSASRSINLLQCGLR